METISTRKITEISTRRTTVNGETELIFNDSFNGKISQQMFIGVDHVVFGMKFNGLIKAEYFDNVKTMILGWNFNNDLDDLPSSLTKLVTGHRFNSKIVLSNCVNLKSLTFGYDFDQIFNPADMPPNLVELFLGYKFNKQINLTGLLSLKILEFGRHFDQSIENMLPNSLEKLTLDKSFTNMIDNLPPSVFFLRIRGPYNGTKQGKIPDSVVYLIIENLLGTTLDSTVVPPSVQHLGLYGLFNQSISKIPPNVTHVYFDTHYRLLLADSVPQTVQVIRLYKNYKYPVPTHCCVEWWE